MGSRNLLYINCTQCSIRPVSYTHLDVYKRQVFSVLARRGISDITDERTHYICSDHVNTTKEEVPPSVKCSPVKELASIDGGFFSSFSSAPKSTAETLYGGALPPIETQMTNSKFSVLMSVYNKEKPEYLDLALKSNLENQTLRPNEMILICDGVLTEELYNVISKYEMKSVSYTHLHFTCGILRAKFYTRTSVYVYIYTRKRLYTRTSIHENVYT